MYTGLEGNTWPAITPGFCRVLPTLSPPGWDASPSHKGVIHNTRFTSKTAPKVVEICITTTQLFNRNSLSVCNERRRPDISHSLSAPCEKGENRTVATIRRLESCYKKT